MFGCLFNQSLDRVTLSGNLHGLTFGQEYNQSLDRVTLPSNHLTFCSHFNQSLAGMTLPASCKVWLLVSTLIKASIDLLCRTTCLVWLSVGFSTKALKAWPCPATCNPWRLASGLIRASNSHVAEQPARVDLWQAIQSEPWTSAPAYTSSVQTLLLRFLLVSLRQAVSTAVISEDFRSDSECEKTTNSGTMRATS